MRNIHVWNLLAVHIPNPLPRTIFGLHVPWLRKSGRMLWATILFAGGLGVAAALIKRPKRSAEPSTWVQSFLGAMYVWAMFALGYGVIPHEWLTFGNSYLNFDSSSYALHKNNFIRFDITRDKIADAGAAIIYVVVLTLNVAMFAAWQKRKVAEPVIDEATGEPVPPKQGGSPLARLRARREERTSAFGRPVTTTTSE